jgi:hypothetical protein
MDNIDMHDVAPSSDAERGLIEAECSRLIASFVFLVDHRRYAELVALFTEDASFERPGGRGDYHVEGADGRVSEISSPAAIAEFHDVFRRTQQGWRIHQRVAEPVLIFKH